MFCFFFFFLNKGICIKIFFFFSSRSRHTRSLRDWSPDVCSSHLTYVPPIQGVTLGHHDLSHHGKEPGKLAQLKTVEIETMKTLRDMLTKLKTTKEEGANLLDRTAVFLGSNLGDGSSHSVKNLPVLLAGGGFRHGQHLRFDADKAPPLCNLYVSMLQRLGVEADKFSTGT